MKLLMTLRFPDSYDKPEKKHKRLPPCTGSGASFQFKKSLSEGGYGVSLILSAYKKMTFSVVIRKIKQMDPKGI